MELIENPTITNRLERYKRGQLERNWKIPFSSSSEHPIDRRAQLPTATSDSRESVGPLLSRVCSIFQEGRLSRSTCLNMPEHLAPLTGMYLPA
jgi:hypothetical protein